MIFYINFVSVTYLHFSCYYQDEYSLVPQSYSMNIDGYVLVYSVTSDKRYSQIRKNAKAFIKKKKNENVFIAVEAH